MGNPWGTIIGAAVGGTVGAVGGYREGINQQDAANRSVQESDKQLELMKGYYNQNIGQFGQATQDWKTASQSGYGQMMGTVNQGGNSLMGLGAGLGSWYNQQAHDEYQGALKDIYTQGRNQAAGSGLIGGFQEGQNTAPAIAALGRSFATQQTDIARQNMNTQIGLGQTVYGAQTQAAQYGYGQQMQPYANEGQVYGNLANQALQGVYGAGQTRVKAAGLYGDPTTSMWMGNMAGSIAGAQIGGGMGGMGGGGK
jgi:hypothetical protein